ncbi:MAG: amphi-Trp domain-containing protein [Leptolyngbyaceae cyanobacterium CSU_1_4]|nr:amphi-Trp domain-containing protein [Leptolyngbyaceae cyanobacterium CSU_1_4]
MSEALELEQSYSKEEIISELRRLADALEQGQPFEMMLDGTQIQVPPDVTVEFEYEENEEEHELEIEFKWNPA